MEWIKTSEKLPERTTENYSQVKCIVNKKYEWKRGERTGHYFEIEMLVFNHEHECWDDEDGDDYNCDINQVTHWMSLPTSPEIEDVV